MDIDPLTLRRRITRNPGVHPDHAFAVDVRAEGPCQQRLRIADDGNWPTSDVSGDCSGELFGIDCLE